MSQPYDAKHDEDRDHPDGSALHRNHKRTSRANTPGTARWGSPSSAAAQHDRPHGALGEQQAHPRGGRSAEQHPEQDRHQELVLPRPG